MRKILVVDDEKLIRDLLKNFLEKKDYWVITAKNGKEALHKMKEKPDLVLLDVKMPGMNGLEVLKKIKEIAPSTGVVMVTGLIDEDIARACVKAGAYDYVTKPIDMKHLETVVELYMVQIKTGEETADDIEVLTGDTSPETVEKHYDGGKKKMNHGQDIPGGIEKRKCRRFHVSGASGKIKKSGILKAFKGYSKAYPVLNISKGGLAFSCSEPYKKDQKIIFQLLVPGEPALNLHSIIKRVGTPGRNGKRTCGIQFMPFGTSSDKNPVELLNVLRKLDEKYGE